MSLPRFVAISALALLSLGHATRAEDAPAKPKMHAVTSGPFESTITVDGWVHSTGTAEVVLKPEEWSAFTVETAIEAGSQVKAGDPLVTFDTQGIDREINDLKNQIAGGELGIKLAKIELEMLEKATPFDLEAAERAATIAKEEWDYYQKLGETLEKESTEQNLKNVNEMLEGSQEELTQLEKMYKADDLTEETEEIILKRAHREVERGQFLLKQSQVHHDRRINEELPREKRLKEVAKDREAQALEKARVALPLTVSQKKVELEKLEHAQKQLTQKLERIQKDRELMTIKAPVAGFAMHGQAERGRWVTADTIKTSLRRGGSITANQVMYTVISNAQNAVHIDLPEKERGLLKVGMQGKITPTLFSNVSIPCELMGFTNGFVKEGTFGGFVRAHAPAADNVVTLTPITGMTVKVRLVVFSEKDVIAVPSSAVFTDEDDPQLRFVYLAVADGEPRKQTVEVGHSSATRTHIKSGLKTGDQILLTKPEAK